LPPALAPQASSQPLSVRPGKDGRFTLVAGHRRFAAAQQAGLKEVPIVVSEGNAHLSSLVENIHREELDPIDAALGLRALAGDLNLETNKAIAEKVGKSVPWVSERLRLLSLPKGVQRYVAEGFVPIEGERLLRHIAVVSPRVAECVCELAKRQGYKGRYFIDRFGDIFAATAEAHFNNKPTMISVRKVPVSVVARGKKRRELTKRLHALTTYKSDDPGIRFGDAEIDAARALGCLVEHRTESRGMASTTAFITDKAVVADLFDRGLEQLEAAAKKKAEEEAAWKGHRKELGESEKDERAVRREEAKARKEIAEIGNEEVAGKLLKARTGARRKQLGLARYKALALLFIDDNPQLAGAGLRLTLPGLRDIDVTELKSGKERKKVIWADAQQCEEELRRRVREASTEAQVGEVMAEAIAAAEAVDQEQLPQSKRIHWFMGNREAEKLLAPDIKAARPRRRRVSKK